MADPQVVTVRNRTELRDSVSRYAAKGYQTVHSDDGGATLSRKKPFNWVLAIICLFIPILGWIALLFMVMASKRGHQVVELRLAPAALA